MVAAGLASLILTLASGELRSGAVRAQPAVPEPAALPVTVPTVAAAVFAGQSRAVADLAPGDAQPRRGGPVPAVVAGIAAPSVSFAGLANSDVFSATGGYAATPNATGDIGPLHYVQATNKLFRVYNRSGAALSAPFQLLSLFGGAPGCGTDNSGGAQVVYDPFADRWLLAQQSTPSAGGNSLLCLAVSQTPDPLGSYFTYAYVTPSTYPMANLRIGVWPDGYYAGADYPFCACTDIAVFDRLKMVQGDPAASRIYMFSWVPGLTPSDHDGWIAPPVGRPDTFVALTAGEVGDRADGLRLVDVHADFATPSASWARERIESSQWTPFAVAAFDPTNPGGVFDIPQPAPANVLNALDALATRVMPRVQYRTNGTVESLVLSHTVGAPASVSYGTYRAGVRYYQITRTIAGGKFGVFEQGTYAPADDASRWVPSAAIDRAGNLAVGYSVSSTSVFPSIRYAGRLAGDPAGTLAQGEGTIVGGTGAQTSTSGAWGPASSLTVDPVDDCAFYYTNEYYQSSSASNWATRIASFQFPECTAAPTGMLQGTVTASAGGAVLAGAAIRVSAAFATGSLANGAYARRVPPGTYTVTVGKAGYLELTVPNVAVSANGTTTLNAALVAAPVIYFNGASLSDESLPNGALDPGETVTMQFSLGNLGPNASSVSATLLPTGGVVDPPAVVNYGAIGAGASASQPFTFRIDPLMFCGVSNTTYALTATLLVSEAGSRVGTFDVLLPLAGNVFTQNFNGVAEPALPSRWTNGSGSVNGQWITERPSVFSSNRQARANAVVGGADVRLDSPPVVVPVGRQFSFKHGDSFGGTLATGAVLELSIDGGAFVDLVAAGGSFTVNGYDGTVSPGLGNPLGGRNAWTQTVASRVTTGLFPPSAAGRRVVLRFRMGAATASTATWVIDDVSLPQPACSAGAGEMINNGGFSSGADGSDKWLKFALPDMSYMPWSVTDGSFRFYRATGSTQGVVFQQTGVDVDANTALEASLDLTNSTTARKRVSVLLHDSDFSDLSVCTFWVAPGAGGNYRFSARTHRYWANATISIYAASVGNEGGGAYVLDNVSLRRQSTEVNSDRCVSPGAALGVTGGVGEMLVNGTFGAFGDGTLAPWTTFGNISYQLNSGVFQFFKLAGAPAGVLLQPTGLGLVSNQRFLGSFSLGNTSTVRQRVTILVHDLSFSDLLACTFWLEPGDGTLRTYGIAGLPSTTWTNATLSVYPATVGTAPSHQWLRFDNASLQGGVINPSNVNGTMCFDPNLGEVPN